PFGRGDGGLERLDLALIVLPAAVLFGPGGAGKEDVGAICQGAGEDVLHDAEALLERVAQSARNPARAVAADDPAAFEVLEVGRQRSGGEVIEDGIGAAEHVDDPANAGGVGNFFRLDAESFLAG